MSHPNPTDKTHTELLAHTHNGDNPPSCPLCLLKEIEQMFGARYVARKTAPKEQHITEEK